MLHQCSLFFDPSLRDDASSPGTMHDGGNDFPLQVLHLHFVPSATKLEKVLPQLHLNHPMPVIACSGSFLP